MIFQPKKQRFLSVLITFLLLFLLNNTVFAQFSLMLDKKLINLYPPDYNGTVMIYGVAKAIITSAAAEAEVVNLEDNSKVPFTIRQDGSFVAYIKANAGESVRVVVQSGGKKSYRTFTVPPRLPAAAQKNTDLNYRLPGDPPAPPQAAPAPPTATESRVTPPAPRGSAALAVLVTVIDTQSGRIIANERIVGTPAKPDPRPGLLNLIAEHIIFKCRKLVQSEMLKSAAYSVSEEPLPPEFTPGSFSANDPNQP